MGNPVLRFEIGAADNAALKTFYAQLFGWTLQDLSGGGYTVVDTCAGQGILGGIGRSNDGTPWATFYVEVPDLQSVLDRAEAMGGKTVVPILDIPNWGSFAMFNDADGLLIGVMKSGSPMIGQPSPGQGVAVDYFEVLGSSGDRVRRFYSELFGWQIDGAGEAGYWTFDTGAGRGISGGVGAGGDSRWATIYARVPDVQKTLDQAEQLGGSRVYGPNTVSGDTLTGAFRDPAGNIVGVYQRG
jgi:predicted enzyme related to lactoylglutathione lyase